MENKTEVNEPVNGEWISVNDRLPESNGWYLTIYSVCIDITFFYKPNGTFHKSSFKISDPKNSVDKHVAHWMPLPTPPLASYVSVDLFKTGYDFDNDPHILTPTNRKVKEDMKTNGVMLVLMAMFACLEVTDTR